MRRRYSFAAATALLLLTGACGDTTLGARRIIARSVGHRPLRVLEIGFGPRRVLWIGGIHGDEPQGAVATRALPRAFAAADLSPHVRLTILEDDNPDGRALHTRENANGVDLNRNFPATNFDPRNRGNGGEPLNQPESRALYDLIQRVQPELIISCHAYRNDHFINYDGPGKEIATRFSELSGFPVKPSTELEATPGSLGSLIGRDRGIPILTIEFLRGSDPTHNWQRIRAAALAVIKA